MELGFVIGAQIVILGLVSIVPMMVLRQNAAENRVRVMAQPTVHPRSRVRR